MFLRTFNTNHAFLYVALNGGLHILHSQNNRVVILLKTPMYDLKENFSELQLFC
ncbi:uncharacterized protein PWA37_002409 [Arxiozyma heterogenica]|uniref:uncharacterized protein n=1 Tax=Arxiozyma heterogenica TaxID=278026 RepID=UPI002EEEE61C